MLTIAICDDSARHRRYTAQLVRRALEDYTLELDEFSTAESLRKCVSNGDYHPDIAILDVELGEENGIELAKSLNRFLPDCRIVFLSGYARYASASYEAEHVWYVLKSQAEQFLGPALRRAAARSKVGAAELLVRWEGNSFSVPLNEILYFEREDRKTWMVCREKRYRVSGTPDAVIGDRFAQAFVRCHQSCWVRLASVASLEREQFILDNGQSVPIGRTYRANARERFFSRFE